MLSSHTTSPESTLSGRLGLTIAALLLCLFALPLRAIDKIMLRGLDADKVYDVNDVDTVDTFTGNLMQQIPIGPEFGSNGALKYAFRLVYNSRAWDHVGLEADGSARAVFDIGDYQGRFAPVKNISGTDAIPLIGTNAGLGWRLSVGGYPHITWSKIAGVWYPRVAWVTSDGSVHEFYRELHGPAAAGVMPEARQNDRTIPYYTRDGSYLRMRVVQAPDSFGKEIREIDTPDGIIYRIGCVANCLPPAAVGQAEWYVLEIRDKFGSTLTMTRGNGGQMPYPAAAAGSTVRWTWTFTQFEGTRQVRTHEVDFNVRRRMGSRGNQVDEVELLVDKVRLNVGTIASADGYAQYAFHYVHPLLHRDIKSTWGDPNSSVAPFAVQGGLGYIDAALLTRVVLPANQSGSATAAGEWQFRYMGDKRDLDGDGQEDFPLPLPMLQGPQWDSANFTYFISGKSGLLTDIAYPTGRGYRYDYDSRRFHRAGCDAKVSERYETLPSVRTRTLTRPGSTAGTRSLVPGARWLYEGRIYDKPETAATAGNLRETVVAVPCERQGLENMAIVVEPGGRATVTFHSGYVDGTVPATAGWTVTEFGLPLSREEKSIDTDPLDGVDDGGIPISQHVYNCRGVDFDTVPDALRRLVKRHRRSGETGTCGDLPLRQVFVEYQNTTKCELIDGMTCVQGNPRIVRTKTVYNDVCDETGCRYEAPDATKAPGQTERFQFQVSSGFDGLGHFRSMTTVSNFPRFAFPTTGQNDNRTITTNYNPGVSYDETNQNVVWGTGAWIQPAWLLNTYDSIAKSQVNGGSFRTKYTFNQTTGFLEETRRTNGTNLNAADLRATFTRSLETDGKVLITENYYGGDYGDQTNADYTALRRSWLGQPVSLTYTECNGTVVHVPYSALVDEVAARPTEETDGSGRWFQYTYDPLLRVRTITRELGGTVTHDYPALTSTSELVVATSHTSGSNVKESSLTANDIFENVPEVPGTSLLRSRAKKKTRTTWGQADTLRDAQGWVRAERSMAASAALGALTRHEYDIFGRVVRTIPPDNGQTITHTYVGSMVDRIVTNGVALTTGQSITKQLSYDGFGRLVKADEWAIAAKDYRYDAEDRLVEVTGGNQTRTFTYDYRGLLVKERHPELATYEHRYTYDSLGHPRRRLLRLRTDTTSVPANEVFSTAKGFGSFDLQYRYDGAERLIGVDVPGPSEAKLFKSFVYQPGANGRLESASRVNNVRDPKALDQPRKDIGVDMTYTYDDAGRITGRTLKTRGLTATVSYAFDDFDNVTQITYPALTGQGRQVSYAYEHGTLKAVTQPAVAPYAAFAYIGDIGYHENGFWETITRTGRLSDNQFVIDGTAKMRPRPFKIETPGRWDTSDITYDGAGNVQTANYDTYFYDAASRLKLANVKAGPSRIELQYTYDENGNITSIADNRNAAPTTFGVNANNRLTTGAQYDNAGNLTRWIDPRAAGTVLNLEYDAANMATRTYADNSNGAPRFGRVHLYDANDERVAVIDYVGDAETIANPSSQATVRERWSIRGAANELLADLAASVADNGVKTWSVDRHYVHALGRIVAEVRPRTGGEDVLDQHWDHLGSVRCVTLGTGACLPFRKYLPFGEEITQRTTDAGKLRFTGHDRDDDGTNEQYADLDYMHARMYGAAVGRFFSIDPGRDHDSAHPQSWNAYAYVRNNPAGKTDPTGRASAEASSTDVIDASFVFLIGGKLGPVEASISGKNLEWHQNRDGSATDVAETEISVGVGFKGTPLALGYSYEQISKGYYHAGNTQQSYKRETIASHHGPYGGVGAHKHGTPVMVGGAEVRKTTPDTKLRFELGLGLGVRVDINLTAAGKKLSSAVQSLTDKATSACFAPIDNAARQLLRSSGNPR